MNRYFTGVPMVSGKSTRALRDDQAPCFKDGLRYPEILVNTSVRRDSRMTQIWLRGRGVVFFTLVAYYSHCHPFGWLSRKIFRGSSAVEQVAVNHLVVGSNPTPGASKRFFCLKLGRTLGGKGDTLSPCDFGCFSFFFS